MFENQDENIDDGQAYAATLGTIYGIADLMRAPEAGQIVGTPVLLAEQAFVFLAWCEDDKKESN